MFRLFPSISLNRKQSYEEQYSKFQNKHYFRQQHDYELVKICCKTCFICMLVSFIASESLVHNNLGVTTLS